MMKHYLHLLLAAFVLSVYPAGAYCASAVPAEKDWTVMFYFNGKNDLEAAALADFNEIESLGGSSDRVNFVAELGRSKKYTSEDGNWSGVRRYIIGRGTDTARIETPVLETISADMGDWRHLADFVLWSKKRFPAKRYILVMWDHGTGWKDSHIDDYFNNLAPEDKTNRGISIDTDSGNYIRTRDIGRIFERAGRVDIYASDACLMQMASVIYQTGTAPEIILASEDVEPAEGFDYSASFGRLLARPSMSAEELAAAIVSDYANFFTPRQQAVTLSAVRSGLRAELVSVINNLADALMETETPEYVKETVAGTLSFYDPDYRDLYDFAARVSESASSLSTRARAQDVMRFIKDKYVIANGTVSEDFKRAGGVAIYLPRNSYSAAYEQLDFARVTRWDELLKWMLVPAS